MAGVYFAVVLVAMAYAAGCAVVSAGADTARAPTPACEVRALTEAGWACGARRRAARGAVYASFRGVPYARQPLGPLRFKELQPLESWESPYDAAEEGPVCPQHDVFYEHLMKPRGMREDCIRANVHVPADALPDAGRRPTNRTGLPVLVFIHGGGFAFGSGDADLHGPEHLVSKGVIVVTFNYRLNVFGFLSLGTSNIPGNNGLRDMITLLSWVQRNAPAFGGNPGDVTIAGQSAGASAAHLLTLSPAAKGLFNRAILMSGTAIPSFFTTSPAYAQFAAGMLLNALGINATAGPEHVHRRLVDTPLDKIFDANKQLQEQIGIAVFFPVIESPLPGVTAVLDDDVEVLLDKGRGRDTPLLVGYSDAECESFRKRFEHLDMVTRIQSNPLQTLSPTVIFSNEPEIALHHAKKVEQRYFNGSLTLDKYIKLCSDTFYEYPALKLAQFRQATGGAPVFLYQFSYEAEFSALQRALGLQHAGAGHVEDLTFVFDVNSVTVPPSPRDRSMKDLMTTFFTNFMRYSHPAGGGGSGAWCPLDEREIRFECIVSPEQHPLALLTPEQSDLLRFFNSIEQSLNNTT